MRISEWGGTFSVCWTLVYTRILNVVSDVLAACFTGFANLERKVVAATLLRDYRISFVDKDAGKNVKTLRLPLLTMEVGELLVRIEPRSKQ